VYRTALAHRPHSGRSRAALGAVLLAQRRWADAEAECREALRIDGDLAAAHLGLWQALEAQGKWVELEQARSRIPSVSAG
jgi:cytochrome c-type biogenesis protein CcmH/NrfG